ncbi:MAG: alpha/beta hydrolase [Chloroflexi bacterium]|nr:alpha/beta hydrolase [Chloroflexota bacterium]
MKSFWRLLVVVALLTGLMVSGVVSAQEDMGYEETAVTLDNEIAAIVGQPQVDGPVPAVVMLHGFASVKDEVGEMYKRLAAALGERGIASIRIDFRGWGESGGGMENSTVTGMVEDAAVAYEYMASQDFVDASQMGVLGFSLGGRIAIVTAGQNPDWYASMGLWSNGGNIDPVTFQGEEAYDTAQAEGQVTLDLGWTMITLGSEFFDSLTAYDVEEEYPKYSGPVFVVAGTDDPDPAEYFDWYLENAQGELRAGLLVEGGDHIYAVLTDDQTMAEKVIATTADWFAMTLGE